MSSKVAKTKREMYFEYISPKSIKRQSDANSFYILDKLQKFIAFLQEPLGRLLVQIRFEKYKVLFGQRDDDIYVVTYMKSGTTMMQMLLYQLTTDGSMDFDHIYDVSPWITNESFHRRLPRKLPSPRIIKSHDSYHKYDKNTKGKFIYVIRNGMDVAVSYHHQNKNYNDPNLTLDQTYEKSFMKKNRLNWFTFNKRWLQNKKKLDILYLTYEDMVSDIDPTIQKVVKFLDLKVTPEVIARAKERTSFDFMKKHEKKFGHQPKKPKERIYDQFIRKGKVGEGQECLTEEQQAHFQKHFNKHLKGYMKIFNHQYT